MYRSVRTARHVGGHAGSKVPAAIDPRTTVDRVDDEEEAVLATGFKEEVLTPGTRAFEERTERAAVDRIGDRDARQVEQCRCHIELRDEFRLRGVRDAGTGDHERDANRLFVRGQLPSKAMTAVVISVVAQEQEGRRVVLAIVFQGGDDRRDQVIDRQHRAHHPAVFPHSGRQRVRV